jgi:hypothetical protein
MTLTGLLLGLINICIIVAVLVLIGYIVLYLFGLLQMPLPAMVQKLYMIIVALIALYMVVSLLLGMPIWRLVSLTTGVAT